MTTPALLLRTLLMLCFCILLPHPLCAEATPGRKQTVHHKKKASQKHTITPLSRYRGWEYLVARLKKDGINEQALQDTYGNPHMPPLGMVTFSLSPSESHTMYSSFLSREKLQLACYYLSDYPQYFTEAEKRFGTAKEGVAAILLVETQYGKVLGRELILNRLSRIASLTSPKLIEYNFQKLSREDPRVTKAQVIERAKYLDDLFYPEVLALFSLQRTRYIDILSLRGSRAGAFGISQFLPSSFLKFGIDGNSDGKISLFQLGDAVQSTAHFLSHYGWRSNSSYKERATAVWNYNRSDAYVSTILTITDRLERGFCTKPNKRSYLSHDGTYD